MRSAFLLVLALLMAPPALAELDSFGQGTGRDGPLSVTTVGRVINSAVPLSAAAAAGATVVRVQQVGALKAQALVLIHQSSGFPSTTASGGTGSVAPGAVGRWELARVASVTATALTLTEPLVNSYAVPGAQAVLVPEYTDVTVSTSGSLVAPPWNGSSGGILAFLATATVTNNGAISADGAGFQGGVFANHADLNGCTGLDLTTEQGGSAKGEGVVVGRFGAASGRGNLVNGGGGGNCHNSGGGGGGHGNAGGAGGRTASDVDGSRDAGGLGGTLMKYGLAGQALFGGGGGAGEGNDGAGSSGGAGGGFVLVRAKTVTGTGRFSADGAPPGSAAGTDGAGGGGAGGAVSVHAEGQVGCGSVRALGGTGGSVTDKVRLLGPGGGGSGGYVLVQGATVSCPVDVKGGVAGTSAFDSTSHGAGAGGDGVVTQYNVAYRPPTTPTVTLPADGAWGVSSRPAFQGTTDPGARVLIFLDGVELYQLGTGADGKFSGSYPGLKDPLPPGEHRVSVVAEILGAYSQRSSESTFNVAATLADGGVLVEPIIVVPADGESVGPTPLFAGVAPNGLTVGLEVDGAPETITVPVDAFGRFRYQVPPETPLTPGPHFITAHSHTETGESGPFSPMTRFEVLAADAGSGTVDAGTGEPDAGANGPDAGTGLADAGVRDVPVLVVPAEGEVVDSTPLFAGAATPGVSVLLEVDGAELATVVSDATGAFRHPVASEKALPAGAHSVTARMVVGNEAMPRSPATGFQVRGPSNLDVGCGCGASPVSVAGSWALLAGLAAAVRRRRR